MPFIGSGVISAAALNTAAVMTSTPNRLTMVIEAPSISAPVVNVGIKLETNSVASTGNRLWIS